MQLRHSVPSIVIGVCASLYMAGCGSDSDGPRDQNPAKEEYLGLKTPDRGFMLKAQGEIIRGGEDTEYCEVAQLPGDASQTYYVKAIELGNGNGSHHLIVEAADPGSRAEAKLKTMKVGDRVPCLSAEGAFGQGMSGVSGIQQPYGKLEFPEGVGRTFVGGQYIVFDYHYLNTTNEDVLSKSAMVFHLTDSDKITHIAEGFGFYNWTINTPAGAQGSFTGQCHFKQDVMVSGLTRHTHKWGTDYNVWYSGGPRDSEHIWTSTDWEHEVDFGFPEPQLMKAGEGFRFKCDYNNTATHPLRFGTQASDEMCILFGLAWDAGDQRKIPSQSCSITWTDAQGVGHTATEGGGFPKADPGLAKACLMGGAQDGEPSECLKCQCESCGDPIVKCAADKDCQPILDCVTQSGCGTNGQDCQQTCTSVIDQHSSAVGMLQQMAACVSTQCKAACGS